VLDTELLQLSDGHLCPLNSLVDVTSQLELAYDIREVDDPQQVQLRQLAHPLDLLLSREASKDRFMSYFFCVRLEQVIQNLLVLILSFVEGRLLLLLLVLGRVLLARCSINVMGSGSHLTLVYMLCYVVGVS